MIIHAYIQTWNEIITIPYIIRHYSSFCDKIIFNDDNSTDGTREIIKSCPIAELRDLGANGVNDAVFLSHWNNDYKESRGVADWVILADGDEFIYHPNIRGLLVRYQEQGINFPSICGYNMVSGGLPSIDGQIYEEFTYGWHASQMDKKSVFKPELDVAFHAGRHRLQSFPVGAVSTDVPQIALLHYVAMGFDYYNNRQKSYQPRTSEINIRNNWGDYIFYGEEGRFTNFHSWLQTVRPIGEYGCCEAVEAFR